MIALSHRRLFTFVVGLPLVCTGCVQREEEANGAISFTFELWAPMGLILAALLLLYFGVRWLLKKTWRWYFRALGGVGMLLSLFLAIVIVPADFLDYLRIDDARVVGRYGLWFAPTEYDVPFAQLAKMEFSVIRSKHYKGPAPSYFLDLTYRDGTRRSLPMGDLLKAAIHEIRRRAAAADVEVGDLPTGL